MRSVGPMCSPKYLSVREVASRASVAPRTVKRWISAGILPAARLPSPKDRGHLRIRLVDFDMMMTRNTKY
jgi:excisionase family DNA binding protein